MVLLSARTLLSYHFSSQTALLHRYFILLILGLLHSRHLIFFSHCSLLSVTYFSVPLLLLLFAQLRSWFGWLNLLHGNPTHKYARLHRRMSVSQPNLLQSYPSPCSICRPVALPWQPVQPTRVLGEDFKEQNGKHALQFYTDDLG